ncbi:MAG: DUF1501 domain-containing protein, partial [Planctomycetota bacterium]
MSSAENLSPLGRRFLDRRDFMRTAGLSVSSLALTGLLERDGVLASEGGVEFGSSAARPEIDPGRPYAARTPHFDSQAKQVLVIYCPGAVSHVDTFDYKPDLERFHGKTAPGMPTVTFEGPAGSIAKPFWKFRPKGESGKMVSDLLPHLGELVDDFCFVHSLTTQTSAHPQGENFFNTGFTMEGFPSFGSWVTYALGTENEELPAFVAINDPRGLARSGKNNFGNGFLPAAFQGTDFNAKSPPKNLRRPTSLTDVDDRRTVGLLERLNASHLERFPGDSDLAGRIASYELAGRMQMSVPDVMDISGESPATLAEYGVEGGSELRGEYAKNCILARRLL